MIDLRFERGRAHVFAHDAAARDQHGAIGQDHAERVRPRMMQRGGRAPRRRARQIGDVHLIDRRHAAAHDHHALVLRRRQQHAEGLVAVRQIEPGRRRRRREAVPRQRDDSRRQTAAAHVSTAVEQVAVAQQEQMRIQRPVERARCQRRPVGAAAIDLRHTVAGAAGGVAGNGDHAAVALCHQRWIPAAVGHVANADPFFQNRIEQPRRLKTVERIILLGTARHQQFAVRKKGLPGAEHVERCGRAVEAAALVLPHDAAHVVGGELVRIVARAGEEQHLAGAQQRRVHRQHLRVARQQFPHAFGSGFVHVETTAHGHGPVAVWVIAGAVILPMIAAARAAALHVHVRAFVQPVIIRQLQIDLLDHTFRDPHVLARAQKPG